MKVRTVKISFRCKRSSRDGAVKVYTTQRIKGSKHPKQFHLAYIPDNDSISDYFKNKIYEALQKKWEQFYGHSGVEINWKDAEKKWINRKGRKQLLVDRYEACAQISLWLQEEEEVVVPSFGGLTTIKKSMSKDSFFNGYYELHSQIAFKLATLDSADIAKWWEEKEAPRLLYRFHNYVLKREGKVSFDRLGFLKYLLGNIKMGYALKEESFN